MTEQSEVYRFEKCGNTVWIVTAGEGELVCCAQPMRFFMDTRENPKEKKS
jgi:superoxide reductase